MPWYALTSVVGSGSAEMLGYRNTSQNPAARDVAEHEPARVARGEDLDRDEQQRDRDEQRR